MERWRVITSPLLSSQMRSSNVSVFCSGLRRLEIAQRGNSARFSSSLPSTIFGGSNSRSLAKGILSDSSVPILVKKKKVLLELPGDFSLDGLRGPERRQRSL